MRSDRFPWRTIPEQLSEIFLCLSLSAWIYRSADRPWTHRRGWHLECAFVCERVLSRWIQKQLIYSCPAERLLIFQRVWRGAILTIRPCVCVHGPVCVFVCASHNCQSEKLVFLSPQLLHSSCLSLFLSTTPSPPPPCLLHFFFFSLLESLLAQEPSFIHAPGPSMPFSAGCQELLFKN